MPFHRRASLQGYETLTDFFDHNSPYNPSPHLTTAKRQRRTAELNMEPPGHTELGIPDLVIHHHKLMTIAFLKVMETLI